MKKLMALTLLLAGANYCMAQTAGTSLLPADTDPEILAFHEWANRIITASGQTTPYGATGIRERVVAQSAYQDLYQSEFRDSTRYFYPAKTGSSYNFNSLEYRSAYNIMRTQSDIIFNNDYKPDVKMDSLFIFSPQLGLAMPYKKVKVVYDGDDDILEYREETSLTASHFINNYNAQGRLRECLQLGRLGAQWDTTYRKTFIYNAQGLLATDSLLVYNNNGWQPRRRERIFYNTSNQVIQIDKEQWVVSDSAWKYVQSHQFSYYSDGKLKELTSGSYVGTTFVPTYIDSLTYAPGCNFFLARYISFPLSGPTPEPVARYTRHLNAQQLPDTATVLKINNGNTWVEYRKYLLSYNNNNNPIRMITQSGNGYTILSENYYYETYDDPTSVGGVVRTNDMRVYPNPALSELCMEWSSAKLSQQVSVSFYNLAGQIVYSSDLFWKGSSQCINIAGLRPGLHHFYVRDVKGRVLHAQPILKQ